MNTFSLAKPLIALLLAAGLLLPAFSHAQAQAAPLPVEAFFKKPAIRSPILSPSGKKRGDLRVPSFIL